MKQREGLSPERIAYIKKGQLIKRRNANLKNVKHATTALYADGIITVVLSLISGYMLYLPSRSLDTSYIVIATGAVYCAILCIIGWCSKQNPKTFFIIGLVIISIMLLISLASFSIIDIIVKIIVIIYLASGIKSVDKVKEYLGNKTQKEEVLDDMNF